MVDDFKGFIKNIALIIKPLEEIWKYELKEVGLPDYFSVSDIEYNKKESDLHCVRKYTSRMSITITIFKNIGH